MRSTNEQDGTYSSLADQAPSRTSDSYGGSRGLLPKELATQPMSHVEDVPSFPEDSRPVCYDLFCGLGGWTEGFLAEGYRVVGFDIERHRYAKSSLTSEGRKVQSEGVNFTGEDRSSAKRPFNYANQLAYRNAIIEGEYDEYPGELVLQDIRTLHGAQLKDAAIIVASPPCQFFSRMAMPFKMPWNQEEFERRRNLAHDLFWQCWRIQHEACEAAGYYIPLVVENVVGAQKWLGRSRFAYGSFHLWGDIPALMPEPAGRKLSGNNAPRMWSERRVQRLADAQRYDSDAFYLASSGTTARKAASAQIAKIPFPLAQHIARVYKPEGCDRKTNKATNISAVDGWRL